jgi:hypothetical protein
VLAQEIFLYEASNLRSMQITPDGKDVVLASGAPYYQEIYRVSDLSADGTYPTTNYPTSVAIAADGTVAAGTCCGYQSDGSTTNEIFMFAPGSSTLLNTIGFGNLPLQNDGAALTPDRSPLFAVTMDFSPMLNIIPEPEQPGPHPTSTIVECRPGPVAIGQAASCTATVTDNAPNGATAPTSTVTFTSDTSGGSFSGSSCTLAPASASGQASCSVSYTPGQAGPAKITGNYGGDDSHAASSGWTTIGVTLRATATALTCRQLLPVLARCTATVRDTSPGTAAAPTGTVSFTSSGHGLFSATQCTLSGSGTAASCAVYYATSAGVLRNSQTITASYGGDGTHRSSTGSITVN